MRFFSNLGNNLKSNVKMIVISFCIALAAWFLVSVQIFPTIEGSVNDIRVEVQPTDYMRQNSLEIVSVPENSVNIRIEGKRYDITSLSSEDFYASLDLSSVKSAGTFSVPVNVIGEADGEYSIIETDPMNVTIQIDEIVTREYPVEATAPGISLPEGYYVDDLVPSPAAISITGSASVLDKIDRIEARSKYGGIISESHDTQSDIYLYGENGARIVNSDLKLSTNDITVTIPIFKQKELPLTFEFTNVPTNFDINSLKYEIRPRSITVAAPDDSIDNRNELVIATIDLSDINPDQAVTIPIALPEGYKNLSGNNNARIEWKLSNYGKLDFTVDNISLINDPDNYNVSLVTNELVISVIGPSETLSTLTSADFYITVNLLGVTLHEGSQNVPISVMIRGSKQQCWVSGSYRATVYAEARAAEE